MNRQHGFTLMELMVTVAILGILTAIALPSYNGYVRKGRRAAAAACLVTAAQQMERFYTTNLSYNATGSPSAFACDTDISSFYTISVGGLGAKTYRLSAAPKGVQSGDSCGTLSLTQAGVRSPTTANCW